MPDQGSMYFLPRLVGVAKAKEIVFNGDMISAREAKQMGLVRSEVTAENLGAEVQNIASRLAQRTKL